jgi:hypothetical protein
VTLKDTNPKDAISSGKLPLHLVPDTIEVEVALAYLEGALKYGAHNYKIAGVRASVYNAALSRHRIRWWNGENTDPVSHVRHLASIIACAGILLDAELHGKLTDDRPPSVDISARIAENEQVVKHLINLYGHINPRHYTIEDSINHHVNPA